MTDQPDDREQDGPRSSPQTDPTNPWHQEAVGEWVPNEKASDSVKGEPGLTEQDRDERGAS